MSHRIRISRRAARDIEQAYLHIRQDAPQRAINWRERLQEAIASLRSFPERHAILFDAATAGREVRQMTFGVYLVLYSIDRDVVYILTVRHGARRPIKPDDLPSEP